MNLSRAILFTLLLVVITTGTQASTTTKHEYKLPALLGAHSHVERSFDLPIDLDSTFASISKVELHLEGTASRGSAVSLDGLKKEFKLPIEFHLSIIGQSQLDGLQTPVALFGPLDGNFRVHSLFKPRSQEHASDWSFLKKGTGKLHFSWGLDSQGCRYLTHSTLNITKAILVVDGLLKPAGEPTIDKPAPLIVNSAQNRESVENNSANASKAAVIAHVEGILTSIDPLLITLIGAEGIDVNFLSNIETKIDANAKQAKLTVLRPGLIVSVSYTQMREGPQLESVQRTATVIRVIPDPGEVKSLISGLGDFDRKVTDACARRLSLIGEPAVLPLTAALTTKTENNAIREKAALLLSGLEDIRAIESLIDVLKERDWLLRQYAAQSLQGITKHNLGESQGAWLSWWAKNKEIYFDALGSCVRDEPVYLAGDYPCWLRKMLVWAEIEPLSEPTELTRCLYNGQVVYFRPSPGGDQFDTLYSERGDALCAPGGGLAGGGDGKCNDFFPERKSCQVIWRTPQGVKKAAVAPEGNK